MMSLLPEQFSHSNESLRKNNSNMQRTPSFQRTDATGAFRRATKPSKVALRSAAGTAKASLDQAGLTVQFGSAAEANALCLPQWRACCSRPRKDGTVLLLVCAHCGAGDHLMRKCPRRLRLVVAGDSHCAVLGRLQHLLPLRISWCKVRGASAAGLGNPRSVLRAADAMLATLRASFVDDGGADRIVIVAGQVDLDFVTPYRALRKARSAAAVAAPKPQKAARLAVYRATFEEQLARAIAGLSAFITTRIAGASAPLLSASRVIVHGVHPPPLNNASMAIVIAKHIVAPDRPHARRPGDPRSTARGSTMEDDAAEEVAPLVVRAAAPAAAKAGAAVEVDADAERSAIASELLAVWQAAGITRAPKEHAAEVFHSNKYRVGLRISLSSGVFSHESVMPKNTGNPKEPSRHVNKIRDMWSAPLVRLGHLSPHIFEAPTKACDGNATGSSPVVSGSGPSAADSVLSSSVAKAASSRNTSHLVALPDECHDVEGLC